MNDIALPRLNFTLAPNGGEFEGYIDTGLAQTFASYEWLLENGHSEAEFPSMMNLTTGFSNVEIVGSSKAIDVQLIDNANRLIRKTIEVFAVFNWEHTNFSRYSSPILFGRDFLSNADISVQIAGSGDAVSATVQDWQALEKEVAAIYRARGISAKNDYNLAGHQIDVFLSEETISGARVSTLVECKNHSRPVGRRYVTELTSVLEFARSIKRAQHAIMVSSSGFTHDAQHAAEAAGIELKHIDELRENASVPEVAADTICSSERHQDPKKIFVIMPFADTYIDFYMLAVRVVADELGYVCERADEIEFNGSIRQQIIASLRSTDVVVAELSEQNANVYYELGWADALGKPVILCTRDISSAPFDIRDLNHIVYGSVYDLQDRLRARLKTLISVELTDN